VAEARDEKVGPAVVVEIEPEGIGDSVVNVKLPLLR
jgi:hypothetical protein